MIIKRISAPEGANADELGKYMTNGKHAAPGETHGPKSDPAYAGGLNFVGDTWSEQMSEVKASVASYKGEAEPLQHWIMSWEEGENPTPAQVREAWQTFLRHQGADDHQLLYTFHTDKKNLHSHGMFNRLSPEPGPDGEYRIVWDKGSITSISKGQTHINQIESAHVAIAEVCAVQGWKPTGDARYEWKDGQATRIKRQADPDKIKMGQRIEAWEAREGRPHPRREMAEQAVSIIRAAGRDKPAAVAALASAGITYSGVDYLDKKGRKHTGGKLSGEAGEVKISALPKDCHFLSPSTKSKVKITPYAPIVYDSQEKVNALSPNVHEKGEQHATKVHENIQLAPLEDVARSILEERKTETETLEALADKEITLTRETGIDRKTGKEFVYGKLTRDGESISLKALGQNAEGKALYNLPGLDRQFLAAESARVLAAHAAEGRTASVAALSAAGITLSEVRKTAEDGKEFVYGQLSRGDVNIPLSACGKSEDGKALYSLSKLDWTERNIRQAALRAEALPVIEANAVQGRTAITAALSVQGITLAERTDKITDKAGKEIEVKYGVLEKGDVSVTLKSLGQTAENKAVHSIGGFDRAEREYRQGLLRSEALPVIESTAKRGWGSMVKALADHGIKLSEEPTVIKKAGKETEVTFARLEKDGISVSLKSMGEKDGKALFQARELERRQLATDAAAILDAHGTYQGAETALAAAGIKYERVRTSWIDAAGEEKNGTVARLERAGVTTSTGYAGRDYTASALDRRYMPEAQARSLYLEARQQKAPVAFLAAKGLTLSDIDRVGRVGERTEKNLRPSAPEPSPHAPAPAQPSGRSIIPRSINEILEQMLEAGQRTAAMAAANAHAGMALHERNQALKEKAAAEKALAEFKSQIRHEERKQAPAKPALTQDKPVPVVEPKEKKIMADSSGNIGGAGGMALAPEAEKVIPPAPEAKSEDKAQVDNDVRRLGEQAAQQAATLTQDTPSGSGTDKDKNDQEREREKARERQEKERERAREMALRERERERERSRHRM